MSNTGKMMDPIIKLLPTTAVTTNFIQPAKPARSRLYVTPNHTFDCPYKKPNAFRRLCYWSLLGWKWKDV